MIFLPGIGIAKWKRLIVLPAFLFLIKTIDVIAQQSNADAGLWTTTNLEYNINSRMVFLITEEIRLKENFKQFNLFYTELGLEYKIIKNLKTTFLYRSTQKLMPDNFFSFRHRIQWDILVKKQVGNLNFSFRHRLHLEARNIYSSEKGYLSECFSRYRLQAKYDFDKPYTPYISIELLNQIRDPRNPESDHLLHGARCQLGIDYKLNSHNIIGLYYLVQDRFTIEDSENLCIIGLEYTFKL